MTLNRSGFDLCVLSLARKTPWNDFTLWAEVRNFASYLTIWNSANAGNPTLSHRRWMSPDIHRNTPSPWSSWLLEDLMVYSNSQDENISLLMEIWLCSMSRELSVRPYFGTYLQTSTQSLFWLMYFFPFGKSCEKDYHNATKKRSCCSCCASKKIFCI